MSSLAASSNAHLKYDSFVITGPTATGKSAVALDIAKDLALKSIQSVIINADSKQIYASVPIITAQPTSQDLKICQHYLYGFYTNKEALQHRYSVAKWFFTIKDLCFNFTKQGILPIIVGGSGFYIEALTEGLQNLPELSLESQLKAGNALKDMGHEALFDHVKTIDPNTPSDPYRLVKNYAYLMQFSRSISSYFNEPRQQTGLIPLKFALIPPRELIYKECDQRLDQMLKDGLLHEVQSVVDKEAEICDAIKTASGFCHIHAYLKGEVSLVHAMEKSKQDTRNYAKRQTTWIKNRLAKKNFIICNSKQELRDIALYHFQSKKRL